MIINVILFVLLIQGDQRSPGIIPLAVKDAFSIIQEVHFKRYYFLVTILRREDTHYSFFIFLFSYSRLQTESIFFVCHIWRSIMR